MADREAHIDVEFVHPSFKNKDGTIHPELRLLDRFWFAPTWIMHAVLYAYFGVPISTIVWRYTIPSLCCPLATLWFNCQFHPPNATSKAVCKAIDLLSDPLATFHGEA